MLPKIYLKKCSSNFFMILIKFGTIRFYSEDCQTSPTLTLKNFNPQIIKMQYTVRGPREVRARELEKELLRGVKKPFDRVIRAHIGDSQAMGQKPITFIRQVLALVTLPYLLNDAKFPEDAKTRAKDILESCRGKSIGAYSDSAGIEIVRKHCAEFIERRDKVPACYEDIVLTTGISTAIADLLAMYKFSPDGKKAGIMVPIPVFPLYSAKITEFDLYKIGYFLDESNNWALDIKQLQFAVDKARKNCNPRALVVINPGNPTGQVLSLENIKEIIKFAFKERLLLIADEVYQDNIYDEKSKFHSFKKVLNNMSKPYSQMELISFYSGSKGYTGECGIRGGYVELFNLDSDVVAMYHKLLSVKLCAAIQGQVLMDVITNPPKENEPSYEKFVKEKCTILSSLKLRAEMVEDAFNSLECFSCNKVQGAMYAFPKIDLPPKAIEAAKKAKKTPDSFYAFELLENTGICVVPGTGFGQVPGTYHIRTTILPPVDIFKDMLEKFKKFHRGFLKKYA